MITIAIFDDLHYIKVMLFAVHHLGFDGFDAPDAVGRVYGKITNLKPFFYLWEVVVFEPSFSNFSDMWAPAIWGLKTP
jgi:hypothetical protein